MDRRRATLLVLRALVLFAAAAVTPGFAAGKQSTIKLWDHHVHDRKFRKAIFEEFNKANPDIKVIYTSQVSATYQTILDAAFRSDDVPDIFVPLITGGLGKALELGWVIPLDDVAPSKEELRAWIASFPQEQQPFVEGTNVFHGKVYSWPIGTGAGNSGMLLYWNTRVFGDAGLKGPQGQPASPETLEDSRLFAKKIAELGQGKIYGIVHGIKSPNIWDQDLFIPATFLGWPLAGWPYQGLDYRTGRFDFHQQGLRAYIQFWLDMKKDGSVFPGDLSMDDEQAKFKFSQGLAGMIFGGPWVPGGLLAIDPNLAFDVALPPGPRQGGRISGAPIGVLADNSEYVVSSRTKDPGAVWRVITFMTSQQYQEGWVKAGGGYSVFPQYNKPEYFPHPTIAKIIQWSTVARRTVPMTPADLNGKIFGELMEPGTPDSHETMQAMWIGKFGWEGWDDLERRLNAAFDKALVDAGKLGIKVSRADFIFPDWDPAQNYPPPKKKQ